MRFFFVGLGLEIGHGYNRVSQAYTLRALGLVFKHFLLIVGMNHCNIHQRGLNPKPQNLTKSFNKPGRHGGPNRRCA